MINVVIIIKIREFLIATVHPSLVHLDLPTLDLQENRALSLCCRVFVIVVSSLVVGIGRLRLLVRIGRY